MARIHRPECGENRRLAYPQDKPPAAAGCIVFVERDGVRLLARVESFRDNVYSLTLHADAGQEKRYSLEDRSLQDQRISAERGWTIAVTEAGPADGWRDAACDDCIVCLSERFNVALECRCSIPCVCAECAEKLDHCPQCRGPVNKDRWLRNYGEGNIFSIETAFGVGSVQLYVKSLLGRTWLIESFLEWRVEDFKRSFLTATGFPISHGPGVKKKKYK